jgi:hypothetical protein
MGGKKEKSFPSFSYSASNYLPTATSILVSLKNEKKIQVLLFPSPEFHILVAPLTHDSTSNYRLVRYVEGETSLIVNYHL